MPAPETAHLHNGPRITIDELAVHLSAVVLRLRELALAAEDPATPVELEATIEALMTSAKGVNEHAQRMAHLARIVDGDVPLSRRFRNSNDPWGAAALNTDREDFGGPAVIPTQWQLLTLANVEFDPEPKTTYPEAMEGVPRSVLASWESKSTRARRQRERDAAVATEVLAIPCERCEAQPGSRCKTKTGWEAEQAHAGRQREAEARVDTRLGYLGDNPVAVPGA
ncbi:hypothetical protein ABZ883_04875 [Streptomyces sp. NPDC046977]|uniref:zinc finger domain-containing protein n=1 Tax=Streptomyces sp. NPDC046977 TaxID=3154703 RepID=UPI0033CA173F